MTKLKFLLPILLLSVLVLVGANCGEGEEGGDNYLGCVSPVMEEREAAFWEHHDSEGDCIVRCSSEGKECFSDCFKQSDKLKEVYIKAELKFQQKREECAGEYPETAQKTGKYATGAHSCFKHCESLSPTHESGYKGSYTGRFECDQICYNAYIDLME